jgi:hypothetical protein
MLEPIKTMIYGLRRYDLDRCIALADHMEAEGEAEGPWVGMDRGSGMAQKRTSVHHRDDHGLGEDELGGTGPGKERKGKVKVKGYLSYKTKVYLVRRFFFS